MMTTTQTIDTVRAFLAVPLTALPGAAWIGDAGAGDAWVALRALVGEDTDALDLIAATTGDTIRLRAKANGWREGVTIAVPAYRDVVAHLSARR